jgi:hypothetical protein
LFCRSLSDSEGGDKIKGHPTRRQVIWSQCSDPLLEASQASPMLISNELAHLSNELFKKSSQVFSNAKITTFYAEMSGFNDERPHHEYVMEAKSALIHLK